MAIDRKALVAILTDELGPLADEAGIALADSTIGFKPSIDAVQTIATALPTLHSGWYAPLARYYLLDRIVKRLAVNMAVSVSGDSYSLQHIFDHAKQLRDELLAQVGALVDPAVLAAIAGGGNVPSGITYIVTPFLTGPRTGGDEWSGVS